MPAPRVSRSERRGRSRRLADDDGTELGDFDLEGEPAERAIGRRALEYEKPENESTTLVVVVLLFVLVMGLLVATVSMEHAAALASKAKAVVAGATEPTAVAATVAATVPAAAGAAASAGAPVGAALQSSPPPPPPPPPRARLPRAPRCRELLGSRTSTNALVPPGFCAHFHGDAESCAAHFYRHANGSISLCAYGVRGAARIGAAGVHIGGPDECRPRHAFECIDDETKESHVAGWAGPPGSTPCTPKPSANDYAFEDCQEWCTKGKTAAAASTCTYCKCRACAICRG